MAFIVTGEFSTGNLPGDINGGLDYLLKAAGVVDVAGGSLEVTEKSGTPDLSVDVAIGEAAVANIDHSFGSGSQAYFRFRNTAVENVTINGNASGNPRITSIFLEVDGAASDSTRGSAAGDIIAVDGTPAASPSAPATPVSANKSYLRLADVTVANAASSIVDANISDQRADAFLKNDVFDEPALKNSKAIQSENAAGSSLVDLVKLNSSDQVDVGEQGNLLRLFSNCAFEAYWSTDPTYASDSVLVADQETFDIGNVYDTSNGRFTAPTKGLYLIGYNLGTTSSVDGERYGLIAEVNGVSTRFINRVYAAGTSPTYVSGTWLIPLNAGDYITLNVDLSSTRTFNNIFSVIYGALLLART